MVYKWTKHIQPDGTIYYTNRRKVKTYLRPLDLDHIEMDEDEDNIILRDTYYQVYTEHQLDIIPAGVYRLQESDFSSITACIPLKIIEKDSILEFEFVDQVMNDFQLFLNSKEIYDRARLVFRRGILLYGPPGTGKSTIIHEFINRIKNKDIIILFVPGRLSENFIEQFNNDPRLKIFIFEEFTQSLQHGEVPEVLLNFLDGEQSLTNMFTIATTNYPEKLPANVVERPGRFDKFYKIDYLKLPDKIKYSEHILKAKLSANDSKILAEQKELTVAQLKEILLLVLRDKLTLSDASKALAEQIAIGKKHFSQQKSIGFNED